MTATVSANTRAVRVVGMDARPAFRIAALGGDGIGPEVMREAETVLAAVGRRFGHAFGWCEGQIGGAAIESVGIPLPLETMDLVDAADAVLLGAVGGPRWDDLASHLRPEQALLALRRAMGTFANLRSVRALDALHDVSPLKADRLEGVDVMVVRELTGGVYYGARSREADGAGGERATDTCVYTTGEIARVVRVAAQIARGRRGRVTSVDKANVLETSRLWRTVTTRVMRDEFPDLAVEHMLVDACAMHLIQQPARFDVIVTENMFGDILTDEAATIAGSIGLLPSASLGEPRAGGGRPVGLYEPIHGSAPTLAGTGRANPIGMILSAALMLRHSLGLAEEARTVEVAVDATLARGWRTDDVWGAAPAAAIRCSTREIGAEVARRIEQRGQ